MRAVFSDQRGENYDDPAAEDTNGVFISLHAYGRLLLYPWEHSSYLAPNRDALRRLGRKLGYAPGYKVCNPEICMYRFDGSTTDYAYGTLGVASYTYEIGTRFSRIAPISSRRSSRTIWTPSFMPPKPRGGLTNCQPGRM